MKIPFHTIGSISPELKSSFVKTYQYENYHRLSLFSFFLVFEELGRIFISRSTITNEHLRLNYLMIAFITLTIPMAFYIKQKYRNDMGKIHSWIMNGIIFLIMLWCVFMTLVEIKEANNMNTITLGFFAIAALAFIHPKISFTFYAICTTIFCIMLPQYAIATIAHDHIIDAIFISSIAFILSHIIFKLKLEVFIDKSIIEDRNKKLYNQSIRDSMTNLYNHAHSLELLSAELDALSGHKFPPCLLFLDIDYFKHINDQFGHSIGDRALLDVADIIQSTIRSKDYAGRYGGEEFIVIFPDTHLETAYTLAEEIRTNIESDLKTARYKITISGGIISCTNESVDQNIIAADRLLYQAKKLGRNKIIK